MAKFIKIIQSIIYWCIVLIPFTIAIAPAIVHTTIGIMIFFFFLKKIVKREGLFIDTPINFPFMFLMIAALISFRNSLYFSNSMRGLAKLIYDVFIFLICAEEIKDRQHIKRIILSIILGATLASSDALWQLAFGRDFIRGRGYILNIGLKRATASFPDANVLGVYLSAIVPQIVVLSLFYFKGARKKIMLMVCALTITGIIVTFSRGSALGFYAAILLVAIVKRKKFLIISLLVLLLAFPIIMPKNIKNWAKEIRYNPVTFMLNADRISMYRNTLNMIKHHPVIGVGVNTFSRNYSTYKLPEAPGAETGDSVYAHNNFLHMAGEIGLLGLCIFLWLLFRLFKQARNIYKKLRDEYYRIVLLSAVAGLLAFLVNGMTETSLYYSKVAMIFWYLVGFCLSFSRFTNETNAPSD